MHKKPMDYTICLHTDTHITPIEAGQNFRWAIVIGKNTQLIIAITHHHFENAASGSSRNFFCLYPTCDIMRCISRIIEVNK